VISPLSPPSPPRKCDCLLSDEAHRCRHCVLPGMVAFDTMVSRSLDEEEGSLRVLRSPRPSDAPGGTNLEDSLPAPELHLHIAIEVVGCLCLAQ
jgi:hypothetical protein